MQFQPRPYQREALDAIEACYRRGVRSALMVLPTGTGKTNVFCWLIERRHARGDRRPTLIVAHREELLQQAEARIRQITPGLSVGLERANSRALPGTAAVVASVQTIGRPDSSRLAWMEPGLIIIDEAHHAAAAGYGALLERFAGPKTQVLGVTATPKRMDRQAIHGHERAVFEEVAYTYPIRQAIQDGYLADIRGYRVDGGVDLSGVRTTAGDYNAGELARQVDAPERTDAALRHWEEVARDRRTIAFCASVQHAYHVAEEFTRRGYAAEAADGAMKREDRAAVIRRFRAGQTQVLTNCELFTEGFDVPEAGCALLLRPTQSWSLYVQMVGRITRLAPGKTDAIVIDVVDNCQRHRLATVPAILDLPPGLDLQGQSLAKAAAAIEQMGAKAAVLQAVVPGSWSELQTLLEQVDLLAAIETPEELGETRLRWLPVPGGYQVECGEGRRASVKQDALGFWSLKMSGAPGEVKPSMGEVEAAVWAAEAVILEQWPDAFRLAARKATWHGTPPSEKQVELLRRLGQPEALLAALTKGQASGLITQLLSGRRQPASARR